MNPLVLVALLGFQVSDLSTKVSFEHRGARAAVVLESLSNNTGIRFSTSGQTADEVLIVRSSDAPLKDLMQKIADVASAAWIQEGTGYRLIRTVEIEKREEREHRERLIRQVRRAQETFRKMLRTQGTFDEGRAEAIGKRIRSILLREEQEGEEGLGDLFLERMKLENETPAYRLCAELFSSLEPAALANIERGDRIDFSFSPKHYQGGLPKAAEIPFSRYLEELKLFRRRVGPVSKGFFWGRSFLGLRTEEVDGLRPILTFDRSGFVEVTAVELHVVDKDGAVVDWAVFLATNGEVFQVEQTPPIPRGPDSSSPVQLSRLSEEIAKAEAERRNSPQPSPMSETLREFFLHPEKNELGALAATDFLYASATAQGLNLVASLPDHAALSCLNQMMTDVPRLGDVAEWIVASELSSSVRDNWMSVKPEDPFESRSFRVKRSDLGTLCRAAYQNRRMGLDELAAFATGHPNEVSGDFATQYVELALVGLGVETLPVYRWDLLRLHGSLTVEQRRLLDRGGALPIQNLASQQRDLLTDCVIEQSGIYAKERNTRSAPAGSEDEDNESRLVFLSVPSEAYPRGIPGSAILTREARQDGLIGFIAERRGRTESHELTFGQAAAALLDQDNELKVDDSMLRKMRDFWSVPRATHTYTLDGGSSILHKGELEEKGVRSKTVAKPDQLDPPVWLALRAKLDELRRGRNLGASPRS